MLELILEQLLEMGQDQEYQHQAKCMCLIHHMALENQTDLKNCIFKHLYDDGPGSSVVKRMAPVWGLISEPFTSDTVPRLRLAFVAMFLWSCVAEVLSCKDEPHHSLHASA